MSRVVLFILLITVVIASIAPIQCSEDFESRKDLTKEYETKENETKEYLTNENLTDENATVMDDDQADDTSRKFFKKVSKYGYKGLKSIGKEVAANFIISQIDRLINGQPESRQASTPNAGKK